MSRQLEKNISINRKSIKSNIYKISKGNHRIKKDEAGLGNIVDKYKQIDH